MPIAKADAASEWDDQLERIETLLELAARHLPADRIQNLVRKWLPRREPVGLTKLRMFAMAADSAMLAQDLALFQPGAAGSTPLDRLARGGADKTPADTACLAALRASRFRLLRIEGQARPAGVAVRDVLTDEALRVVAPDMPSLPPGTMLFARAVMLAEGVCCLPGAITPLDTAAEAVAREHGLAGMHSPAAGLRWAEAVYAHVVRNGTLEVPGLNRPSDYEDEDEDDEEGGIDPLLALAQVWSALDGAEPDEELLRETRRFCDLENVVHALVGAVTVREVGNAALANALERVTVVQLETLLRRERSGSSTLTVEAVEQAIARGIAERLVPAGAGALLASLRRRLAGAASGSAGRVGDAELERLVARIQGLRAKTVAQGCTEHEALAAAEKVAELLDRYGLSLGELDFRAQPCEGVGIETDRRRSAPIDACVPEIAAYFDCRVWLEHPKGGTLRYVFFGLRGDVAAAHYLYDMVERAFETETVAFRRGKLYADMAGVRRNASNSFQIGLARGIVDKLRSMRLTREAARHGSSGRDLVPVKAAMVDEELGKLGLAMRQRTMTRGGSVLTDAYQAGEAAGQRFEIVHAVTEAA